MEGKGRIVQLNLTMSVEEKEMVKEAARRAGKTMTDWIVGMAMGPEERPKAASVLQKQLEPPRAPEAYQPLARGFSAKGLMGE